VKLADLVAVATDHPDAELFFHPYGTDTWRDVRVIFESAEFVVVEETGAFIWPPDDAM